MNLGSAMNLQHQYTLHELTDTTHYNVDSREDQNIFATTPATATYVLMRKDTANAMPIVTASSLLMENLEPELCWLSPASPVPCKYAQG